MADHQHAPALLGKRAQPLGFRHRQGQRLLDKDMLAGFQCRRRKRRVLRRRRRNRNAGNGRIAQHRLERPDRRAVPRRQLAGGRLIGIADRRQRAKLGKIADQVSAPITATNDGNRHRHRSFRIVQKTPLPMLPQSG